jgi:glycosyltransferase involved in cell wall biosynthesis
VLSKFVSIIDIPHPSCKDGLTNLLSTPAVAFNVPGLSDSIKNRYNGYLCKDETEMIEKVVEILENKNLRNELSKNSKLWAERFNWESAAKKSISVLNKH